MPRVSSFRASHCRTAVWSLTMHARRTCEPPSRAETLAVVGMSGTLGSRSHLGTGTKVPPCASRWAITWIPAPHLPLSVDFAHLCPHPPRSSQQHVHHVVLARVRAHAVRGELSHGGCSSVPFAGGANSMNEHALRAAPAGADA